MLRFRPPHHFNPRSPHGERLHSIFARFQPYHFNPRSPHGERRKAENGHGKGKEISIHAPRTGSDKPAVAGRGKPQNFNPRSPHGERHTAGAVLQFLTAGFQSTLPARGATGNGTVPRPDKGISIHAPRTGSDRRHRQHIATCTISIHAPRTGSDRWAMTAEICLTHFNPRSPHGERRLRY